MFEREIKYNSSLFTKENCIIEPVSYAFYWFIFALYSLMLFCLLFSSVSAVSMDEIKLSNLESINNYFTNITNNTFYNSTVNESYILKDGLAGGQTLTGGTTTGNLVMNGSMNNGNVIIVPNGGNVGIGYSSPSRNLVVAGIQGWRSATEENAYIDTRDYKVPDFALRNNSVSEIRLIGGLNDKSYVLNGSFSVGTSTGTEKFNVVANGGGAHTGQYALLLDNFFSSGNTNKWRISPTASNSGAGDKKLVFTYENTGSATSKLTINGTSGYVGIGTVNPASQLDTTGSVQFRNCSGTPTFSALGELTCASDDKVKKDKHDYSSSAPLPQPIKYRWNDASGYTNVQELVGFSAQDVQATYPECIISRADIRYEQQCVGGEETCETAGIPTGTYTLSIDQTCMLAAAFNTINRQQALLDRICSKGNPSLCEV